MRIKSIHDIWMDIQPYLKSLFSNSCFWSTTVLYQSIKNMHLTEKHISEQIKTKYFQNPLIIFGLEFTIEIQQRHIL